MEFTCYRIYENMAHQTHLLVAGAAGSGKSVVINGIIHYILATRRPGRSAENHAQLILIDPKRVELSLYKRVPHTICCATEQYEIVPALHLAMDECERRFSEMEKAGDVKFQGGDLYVIIDEFADLMTTQRKAVVPLVQRLAQIGRAAKVHLIIGTQTPIAKVLPTEIKCNFDSRVGLRTRSAQDSRNILGYAGLEDLPRYGEGIYMTPESEDLWKIPMVPRDELKRVVAWWESQRPPAKKRGLFGWLSA